MYIFVFCVSFLSFNLVFCEMRMMYYFYEVIMRVLEDEVVKVFV